MDRTIRTTAIIAALFVTGCASSPPAKPAPDFSVERVEKPISKVTLKSLRGKVVLLDFWATWCGPCKVTMPAIDRLYKTYKDKGFDVMAISSEKRAEVRSFWPQAGVSYPAYVDVSMEASGAFNVDAIPRVVVVDRKGMIVYDKSGIGSEKELEDAINAAL